jgi:hypothetical protein
MMVHDWFHASFNAPTPHLHQPLSIMGLNVHSLDFVGTLGLTICYSWYMVVMIDYFSNWIELA